MDACLGSVRVEKSATSWRQVALVGVPSAFAMRPSAIASRISSSGLTAPPGLPTATS